MAKRHHRSKYNFSSLKEGDLVEVDPLDVHTMKVALYSFNKYHDRSMEVEMLSRDKNRKGLIEFKVTKV